MARLVMILLLLAVLAPAYAAAHSSIGFARDATASPRNRLAEARSATPDVHADGASKAADSAELSDDLAQVIALFEVHAVPAFSSAISWAIFAREAPTFQSVCVQGLERPPRV